MKSLNERVAVPSGEENLWVFSIFGGKNAKDHWPFVETFSAFNCVILFFTLLRYAYLKEEWDCGAIYLGVVILFILIKTNIYIRNYDVAMFCALNALNTLSDHVNKMSGNCSIYSVFMQLTKVMHYINYIIQIYGGQKSFYKEK